MVRENFRFWPNSAAPANVRFSPLGADATLCVVPSLAALNARLLVSQTKQEQLELHSHASVKVVDKKPCNLMICLVELPSTFDVLVIAEHPLTDGKSVRKQCQEACPPACRKRCKPLRLGVTGWAHLKVRFQSPVLAGSCRRNGCSRGRASAFELSVRIVRTTVSGGQTSINSAVICRQLHLTEKGWICAQWIRALLYVELNFD